MGRKDQKPVPGVVSGFTPATPKVKPRVTPKNPTDNRRVTPTIVEKKKQAIFNEQFGDINLKFTDEMGRMLTYRQAEGIARKRTPMANDGRFQLKFSML